MNEKSAFTDWINIHNNPEKENELVEYCSSLIKNFYSKILNSENTNNKELIVNMCNGITETISNLDKNTSLEKLKVTLNNIMKRIVNK